MSNNVFDFFLWKTKKEVAKEILDKYTASKSEGEKKYKPSELDEEAAMLAATYPEHVLRAATVLSANNNRSKEK